MHSSESCQSLGLQAQERPRGKMVIVLGTAHGQQPQRRREKVHIVCFVSCVHVRLSSEGDDAWGGKKPNYHLLLLSCRENHMYHPP